jgi:hypothetical protein
MSRFVPVICVLNPLLNGPVPYALLHTIARHGTGKKPPSGAPCAQSHCQPARRSVWFEAAQPPCAQPSAPHPERKRCVLVGNVSFGRVVNWSVGNERERGIEHPHLAPTPILRSTRCYSTQRLFHGCRHSTATLAGWLARRALAHPPVPYPSRPGRTDNIGDSKTKNPVGSIVTVGVKVSFWGTGTLKFGISARKEFLGARSFSLIINPFVGGC